MDVYRAYFLDREGKIAKPPEVLECDSDQAAIELAKPMVDGHDIEVWQGNRMITILKHTDERH
jgi:hypothetical protein